MVCNFLQIGWLTNEQTQNKQVVTEQISCIPIQIFEKVANENLSAFHETTLNGPEKDQNHAKERRKLMRK